MSTIVLPLFNRDFRLPVDGKVQVVPMGEYPVEHAGRVFVQVVDNQACDAMLANLQRDAQGENFAGLCCDFEHFRHDPDKESRAAAWFMDAEKRPDGIYAAPRLTNCGRAAVEGGDYRFISPEFSPSTLEPLGGNRYRVTQLVGFGLTNSPNMRGIKPLSNRLTGDGGVANVAAQEAAHANLVAALASTLRKTDKLLSLAESYRRAGAGLQPDGSGGRAVVISNRAAALRAGDKTLSLSASYRMAEAKSAGARP